MIGERNLRATLLQKISVPDGGGGFGESWQNIAAVWIDLAAQSVAQDTGADAVQAKVIYRARLRRTVAAAGMRLGADGRLFDILAVEADASGLMTLICEALP